MKTKKIAENAEGEFLMNMKEGKEQESLKSIAQKNEEACNFVKNVFAVDGKVKLYTGDFRADAFFRLEDSKRGKFRLAIVRE